MAEYDGAERSATERLRALLDARGVKWEALSDLQEGEFTITATRWHDCEGGLLTMCISEPHGSTCDFFWLPTPEQAVEATLGKGTCKYEYRADDDRMHCSECGQRLVFKLDFMHYCPNCGRMVGE